MVTWNNFFLVASLALYWSVGSFQQVNDWQQTLQRYPDVYQKLFEENAPEPEQQDLQDLMTGLRVHLVEQPDDLKGWLLYSRLGTIFNDAEIAIAAMDKALALDPDNVEVALESIELKMKIGDQYEKTTAELALKRFCNVILKTIKRGLCMGLSPYSRKTLKQPLNVGKPCYLY
ncbi:tetratricopeptide repeat protein [Psychromonas sp. KJ10-2]|uniref:tetratricopeptide repeat protein n=1 Tax=Psychromonas sp. KJ10-2 TaxID=3391822 RepID=UPI0039B4CC4D